MKNYWGPFIWKTGHIIFSIGMLTYLGTQLTIKDVFIAAVFLGVLNWWTLSKTYSMKIDGDNILITRFRHWHEIDTDKIKSVNLQGSFLSLYIDNLNIIGHVEIPFFCSSSRLTSFKYEIKRILSENKSIKIFV